MPKPEDLERLLQIALAGFPRKSPVIDRWRSAKSLFSAEATFRLAEFIVSKQSNVASVLKLQYVGQTTRLGLLTQAKAAELASQQFRQIEALRDEKWCVGYIRWMINDLFTDTLMPDALRDAVSSLILSRIAERSDESQKLIRDFVQASPFLGDPRLSKSAPHWRGMVPEAVERYRSWLAKESILFFFNTILPRNDGNRRRAEFWLRYHERIVDFQVALSDEDLIKVKSSIVMKDIPLHSRIDKSPTSAFLMKFRGVSGDVVIVEFSETGNAAYIYERGAFESKNVNFRTPFFQLARHLKHEGHAARILHQGAWEYSARYKLSGFGIRP